MEFEFRGAAKQQTFNAWHFHSRLNVTSELIKQLPGYHVHPITLAASQYACFKPPFVGEDGRELRDPWLEIADPATAFTCAKLYDQTLAIHAFTGRTELARKTSYPRQSGENSRSIQKIHKVPMCPVLAVFWHLLKCRLMAVSDCRCSTRCGHSTDRPLLGRFSAKAVDPCLMQMLSAESAAAKASKIRIGGDRPEEGARKARRI